MMTLNRHLIRVKAFQALYPLMFNPESQLTVQEAIDQAFTGEEDDIQSKDRPDYLLSLVEGVLNNQESIDEKISSQLTNWTLDQMNQVDALILRLGTYEMLYTDVPAPVVIDEMVKLGDNFSDDRSGPLINGVLDSLAKNK